MATTSPARIDDELYASAKLAGSVQSRSASQQVAHWARIGREIEASGSITAMEIHEVLAGSRSYDALTTEEQAEVRAEWSVRMDERRTALDLASTFSGAGRTWVELDGDGNVVERGAEPADQPPVAARARPTRNPSSGSFVEESKGSPGKAAEGGAVPAPARTKKAQRSGTRAVG